eukprot:2988089-Alexandrium_andersonii.AAC.1
MEVGESHNLQSTPHGSSLRDLTEGEQRWIKEEQEVRAWALAHPDRWQTTPRGSEDDSEAFERFVYLRTPRGARGRGPEDLPSEDFK